MWGRLPIAMILASLFLSLFGKGQIKPKADWRAVDSPKKRMNEFGFFAVKSKKAKKNKFVHSFFGRIYGTPICLQFYLTFSSCASHAPPRSALMSPPPRPNSVGTELLPSVWAWENM